MKKIIFLFFLSVFYLNIHAQEVCTNGIDDDGDGLIDLNDTADCRCNGLHGPGASLHSYIPNPSFEQQNCCPSTYSQMNCASGWVQASHATSDYMSHCPGGYVGGALIAAGLNNFPDGNSIVGCIFQPNWQEYVGSCLLQPMHAGTSYTIQLNIASTPVDGQGGVCNNGNIFYGDVDVTIFGSTSCANLPFSGAACPAAPAWRIMGKSTYTPLAQWGILTITFTPTFDVYAIILGSPCALPASYNTNLGCSPYFYFDNLILNTTAAFANLNMQQTGLLCKNDVVLKSHVDTTGGGWQWFKNGIAIQGQNDSVLNVSANGLGEGYYSAMYSVGNECQIKGDSVVSHAPVVDITSHVDVYCNGGNDGYAHASITGGYGNITYDWNTVPAQHNASLFGLRTGTYVITVSDTAGCQSSDTVNIVATNPTPVVNNIQTVCNGEVYNFNGNNYFASGTYYDTLSAVSSCDSIVVTQLTILDKYIMNNPQWICGGETYSINNHTYSVTGLYNDTLHTINGCDSIVVTNIMNAQSYQSNSIVAICSGESYSINSHQYSQQGNYRDTLTSKYGCDSIVTTQLSVLPAYIVNNIQTICDGDSYHLLSHSYSQAGEYKDTIQSIHGCDSIITTHLSIKPRPQLTFNRPPDVCVDATPFELTGGNPPGGNYFGSGVVNNEFNPAIVGKGIHTISYSFTDGLTSCSNTIEQRITVNPLPEVQFTLNPKVTWLANSKITFLDYTSNAKNWEWDFGDGESSIDRYGFHSYKDTGHYQVNIIVTDNHGCINWASDGIYIGLEFVFNVPNAFTPNGDGVNDSFNGVGIGIGKYRLSIFNRWGKEIFTSNDLFKPWNGEGAMEDAYVYKINLEDITGKEYEFTGEVTLIK